MPRLAYRSINFKPKTLELIEQADALCRSYEAQGYVFTLRQLYYQLVARNIIANKVTEYDRLGAIITDARYAGLIDWGHLEDRVRNIRRNPHWDDPANGIEAIAQQYRVDVWEPQETRPEVWIEKNALIDVIADTCRAQDVEHYACIGYVSASEMWRAAQRMIERYEQENSRGYHQRTVVIHMGDHDPSGIQMTEDIEARLREFGVDDCIMEVKRIALNFNQVERYSPPPNPAKTTDSRYRAYIRRFGASSWELDALDPPTLNDLVLDAIERERDAGLWREMVEKQEAERRELTGAAMHWPNVRAWMDAEGYIPPTTGAA